jgi:hypothetical protein
MMLPCAEVSRKQKEEETPDPPKEAEFSCDIVGQEPFKIDWNEVKVIIEDDAVSQVVRFPNG